MRPITQCLALVLLVGCGSATSSVRLQGEPLTIAAFTGEWAGEYWGGSSGRFGTLSFSLPARSDSLYGDVTMLTSGGLRMTAADPVEVHRLHVRSAQSLRIDFVAVGGRTVTGTLEPYVSPDCSCLAVTTFTGRLEGDSISGLFVTRGAGQLLAEGGWMVRRQGTRP